MNHRNWLDLSRKLVDRFDMDYSFGAVNQFLGQQALSYFGEGVLPTKLYPNPFVISLDSGDMNGNVGPGVAYDPNGQLTEIATGTTTPTGFTIPTADPTNPRWDLVVLRYVASPQVLIPKPSDPIISVYLNLVDDFQVVLIEGTPSATPVYPAKGALDIIIAGLKVPAAATAANQATVDLTVRDVGNALQVFDPAFKQERPAGAINGVNTIFTLSRNPINANSVLVMVDDLVLSDLEWSFGAPNFITLAAAPSPGQTVYVYYVAFDPGSVNPLTGFQEVPSGVINGVNDLFTLVGLPANQASTIVFVDGVAIETTEWNLILGIPSKIQFKPGSIPTTGQTVYVYYLVNAGSMGMGPGPISGAANLGSGAGVIGLYDSVVAGVLQFKSLRQGTNVTLTSNLDGTVTIAASGGGGGGGGALMPYGSPGAPITVVAFLGVAIGTDQRQIRYLQSSGGAVQVTGIPQVQAGSVVGQELILRGTSSVDYIKLADGNGLDLNGPVKLTNNQSLYLTWNGTVWEEITRRV